jgi:hypothetical protein
MDESSVPEIIGLASHQELAQHEGTATALTHPKLDLLRHYRDSLSLISAGFVLVGEGSDSSRFDGTLGYHTQACFHQLENLLKEMQKRLPLIIHYLQDSIFVHRVREAARLSRTLQTLFIHPCEQLGDSMYFLGIVRH